MPGHKHVEVTGRIVDVFAHRFVIDTGYGRVLADLGPKGAERFALERGLEIAAFGEMKPSELKVDRIARTGEPAVVLEHKTMHEHEPADPLAARRAVENAGLTPLGEPRRKPKHFEVLARRGRAFVECHVELDGHIRKERPVPPDDHKWAQELGAA